MCQIFCPKELPQHHAVKHLQDSHHMGLPEILSLFLEFSPQQKELKREEDIWHDTLLFLCVYPDLPMKKGLSQALKLENGTKSNTVHEHLLHCCSLGLKKQTSGKCVLQCVINYNHDSTYHSHSP